MNARVFTHQDLHTRLLQNGHNLSLSSRQIIFSTNVCPSESTIITIALELDPTLRPNYRSRYFICTRDLTGNLIINDAPGYHLPTFDELVSDQERETIDFILGPIQWVFARLMRFVKILIWPKENSSQVNTNWIYQRLMICNGLHIHTWLQSLLTTSSDTGALLIDLSDTREVQLFLDLAYLVSHNELDLFVSDYDCSEVYLLHHHEKIVISIPDLKVRSLLLNQLYQQPDLFDDWSDYEM